MKSSASRFTLAASCLAVLLLAGLTSRSEPFVPKNDRQVIETLRGTSFGPAARELREWRARLAREPENLALAAQFARRCLEYSRAEADPRYIGRAQSALAPWWKDSRPPLEALVLRATIRQSQHDFTHALADLDSALQTAPGDGQSWLTRATILTVLGRYEEARRACLRLAGRAPELVVTTAAVNVSGLTGNAERSCELLRKALEQNPSASTAEKLWALTVLAETNARLGRADDAEANFQRALSLGRRDAYLLGAYTDFLLDQDRAKEAAALLKDETHADNLLLRLALAESFLAGQSAKLSSHVATLGARFAAGHLRGETVHQREEARFNLYLLRRPPQALELARANWQVQREPADARILLEAALAAQNSAAAQPVLEFIRRTRLEDVRLANLAIQITSAGTLPPRGSLK